MAGATATIDRLVGMTGELYSLPAVAVEVLELTSDPRADARRLKECIEKDPALTTKILRVVNSSLFGLSQPVSDLNQALALLGMKPLKLLVLGFSLPDALFAQIGGEVLARYWQRTLIKAIAAREISSRIGDSLGDEAFIAGLLEDIGQLVLVQCVGQPYVRFLGKVQAEQGNLNQLERISIGFDHTQISARLLSHWHLPQPIVEAIAQHHAAEQAAAEPSPLVQVLKVAELVSNLLCDGRTGLLPEIVDQAPSGRGSWLDALLESLQEKVNQLADSLSLELPAGANYREVLDQARTQMAGVAEDLVSDLVRERQSSVHVANGDAAVESQLLDETHTLGAAFATACQRPATERIAQPASVAASSGAAQPTRTTSQAAEPVTVESESLLSATLKAQVTACRQRRVPLSLLLLEIDHFEDLIFQEGPSGAENLLARLTAECQGIDHENAICLQLGGQQFAVVLPDCDRSLAARLGNQLLVAVRTFKASKQTNGRPAITISIGASSVAAAHRNFQADDLLHSASRCLYGARVGGGDVLKSIEIY